jgi:hypothetical protein
MRRVLIATPMDSGADINYLRSLIPTLRIEIPDTDVEFLISDCGSVNFARNELAHAAEQGGFDRLVQIDSDMAYTPQQLVRLLSHDVDLVAGVYCKRKPGKPNWLFVPKTGAETQPNGLLECVRVATGFQNLRVSCISALRKKFPEREFLCKEENGGFSTRFELYPMGVYGPRSPEARLKRIKTAILAGGTNETVLNRIGEAVYDEQPPGTLWGEDYGNCRLLREAGFQVFADLGMPVIPHIGKCQYPVTPDMVGYGEGVDQDMPMAEAV